MQSRASTPETGTVPQALGRLRVAMDDTYTQVSRELGLTAQQAELLCAAMRPAAIGELADVLRCDRSNVSRLVDRAVRRGLLHRRGEEADGRVTVIELTADGQRLAERFIKTLESRLQPLLAGWSSKRQYAAIETLTVLANALEGTIPTAAPARATRRHATRARPPADS
ncbi:MAG: MarR family transcriptional regulator [Actinomycetota bacterium]|nr:MarR family transcriptional regulator [Actinomycetota bacterium]